MGTTAKKGCFAKKRHVFPRLKPASRTVEPFPASPVQHTTSVVGNWYSVENKFSNLETVEFLETNDVFLRAALFVSHCASPVFEVMVFVCSSS